MNSTEKIYELFQEKSTGELFELLSFLEHSACFKRLKDNSFIAVSKPYFIEDDFFTFRIAYRYKQKSTALKATKEINSMYSDYMDRKKILEVSQGIDNALFLSRDNQAVYDDLIVREEYSPFDLACATALIITQDKNKYPDEMVKWADKFIDNNDIDVSVFKDINLSPTSSAADFSEFANEVRERFDSQSDILDLSQGIKRGI